MKWKMFCQIKTVVTLAFGLLVFFVPALLWGLFGFEINDHVVLLSRLIGIVYVALGVMFYTLRDYESSASRKQTAIIVGSADSAAAVLLAVATVQAVANPFTWVLVASYGLFGLALFILG